MFDSHFTAYTNIVARSDTCCMMSTETEKCMRKVNRHIKHHFWSNALEIPKHQRSHINSSRFFFLDARPFNKYKFVEHSHTMHNNITLDKIELIKIQNNKWVYWQFQVVNRCT